MRRLEKFIDVFLTMSFMIGILSSCSTTSPAISENLPGTIPYSESRMAEFSKEFRETNELYVESNNGKTKTVIDIQSGNSYEETTEAGVIEKVYFLNQPNGTIPSGVYRLFEKNQIQCYYPIEGDATIDMYELFASMGNSNVGTVQVSYEGANRVEQVKDGESIRTIVFWGETTIPLSMGRKNDMEDFMINFNMIAKQISDTGMRAILENRMKGYSLYIPTNPYL